MKRLLAKVLQCICYLAMKHPSVPKVPKDLIAPEPLHKCKSRHALSSFT